MRRLFLAYLLVLLTAGSAVAGGQLLMAAGGCAPQTITWNTQPSAMTVGDADQTLSQATASSSLTVAYTSATADYCTIVAGKLHAVAAGTCVLHANQAGNGISCPAAQVDSGNIAISAIPTCSDTTCSGFLVCENFEGTGMPTGWALNGGSPDWDYTTTILRGTQSLKMAADEVVTPALSDQSEIYLHFLYRTAQLPASDQGFFRFYPGLHLYITSSGQVKMQEQYPPYAGATSSSGMSINTTYHIWVHYKAGTGSNQIASIEFTSLATMSPVGSGNNFAGYTAGGLTTAYPRIYLDSGSGGNAIIDQFLWSATEITNVCP